MSNKQRAREHHKQFNCRYEQASKENCSTSKRAANPSLETMGRQKTPPYKIQKRDHELCLCEMPEELKAYVLEHPEIKKVFNQPSQGDYDSASACYKLEIKSNIKRFNLFEFWYMKQLPVEHSE